MQQRIEDLDEEMNNMFTVQMLYLQNMNTNEKRNAAQPPFISCSEANQWSFNNWFAWFCECVGDNNRRGNDSEGGNDSENEE